MINERIRELRITKQLSQTELANKLNVTPACISFWENNYEEPSSGMIVKLSEYFSVSCDYLLGVNNKLCIDVNGFTDDKIELIRKFLDVIIPYVASRNK